MAVTPVSWPGQSNDARRLGEGAIRAARTRAAAPAGRLMKKISRHDTRVSSPPKRGPDVEAATPPMAHTATARARRGPSGKAWLSSAIDAGISTAAAEPCTNRAATRNPSLEASPQAADAATNTPDPDGEGPPGAYPIR
jgi:hypothetical protein